MLDKCIAVTGARGRLGSELVRRGCIPIQADVTDTVALNREVAHIKPDVVVHCAAFTDVDACELSPAYAARVNTGGVYNLIQVFSGKIIYISTDYIFDGENGPYDEAAKPRPISVYGWSKLGGEIVLKNRHHSDDLIVRTTVLFDRYSKNFVTNIIGQLSANAIISLPSELFGSPTYVPHLAQAILEADISGIINLAGRRVISRWRFGQMIAETMNYDREKIIATRDIAGRAPRPLRGGLRVDKAISLGLPIRDPIDGLREIVDAVETMEAG